MVGAQRFLLLLFKGKYRIVSPQKPSLGFFFSPCVEPYSKQEEIEQIILVEFKK